MVSAFQSLSRKFRNTDSIIKSNKSHLIPTLNSKFPEDYLDEKTHNTIQKIKPWAEIPSPIARETFGIMKTDVPRGYERWERDKKFGFTSLQPSSIDKILVLCVDFDDKPAQIPVETIYNRFFGNYVNSLSEYYREVSHGRYIPIGETYGWYRAPQQSTYYTDKQNGFGIYPNSAERLVENVVEIANNDPNIDWDSFDTNGNGYIDNIFIVHSGAEAAYTGDINDIWAHVYVTPNIMQIQTPGSPEGVNVWVYAMTSEYLNQPSDSPTVGIDCHEFGHLLGLPDLYDYTDESNGVGSYSLMGSGSWGGKGAIPVHMDAWSKYVLGFANAKENPTGNVYLTDIETNSDIVKYTTDDPKQYFLVENRQKIRYDGSLPSEGIFIWRINENQIDNQTYNDDKSCFLVGLLQADNLKDLENRANSGDAGDSYPGISNNRSFGIDTNPNSELCDGIKRRLSIRNISDSSRSMTFDSSFE
jgi:immune inhibitor A